VFEVRVCLGTCVTNSREIVRLWIANCQIYVVHGAAEAMREEKGTTIKQTLRKSSVKQVSTKPRLVEFNSHQTLRHQNVSEMKKTLLNLASINQVWYSYTVLMKVETVHSMSAKIIQPCPVGMSAYIGNQKLLTDSHTQTTTN
jgi:hypothetical protein